MIHYVTVGVALSRPPKIDEYRRYAVVAADAAEAELIAQQIAACSSVMPVESFWESSHRAGPVEPFGCHDCKCVVDPWSEDVGDEEVWDISPRCPHHSEDAAAWVALTRPTKPAECPPGVHSMFDFCPGRAICEDGWQEPGNPPTPETANAGGPDTDDTPVTGTRKWDGVKWAEASTSTPYATGAIVPDELKRRVDTVKVSSDCNCEQIDVTVYADGPHRQYTRGRAADNCPLHGALAQIRAFGHIDVGDRLRVNDFGIWSIERDGVGYAPDARDRVAALPPGSLVCTWCDDWSYTLNGDTMGAYRALSAHWAATTQDGTPECPRSPSQRRTTWWARSLVSRWARAWGL